MSKKKVTYDDTRDVAIRVLEKLIEKGIIVPATDSDDESEFDVQDIIHEEINELLGLDIDNNFTIEIK
jgi:hypothetical protein